MLRARENKRRNCSELLRKSLVEIDSTRTPHGHGQVPDRSPTRRASAELVADREVLARALEPCADILPGIPNTWRPKPGPGNRRSHSARSGGRRPNRAGLRLSALPVALTAASAAEYRSCAPPKTLKKLSRKVCLSGTPQHIRCQWPQRAVRRPQSSGVGSVRQTYWHLRFDGTCTRSTAT